MKTRTNLAASVLARLLNQAKATGDEYQKLLTSYCLERFLHRLGASDRRSRFILKGAMLLRVWSRRPYRATTDLDLLRSGDGSIAAIQDDLRAIIATPVTPDAVIFDVDRIRVVPIRVEQEHAGARAILPTRCGNARISCQVDMGRGDSVFPPAAECTYPSLLDLPPPELLVYPKEAVVAEKFEAMVVLGERNGRIKDFFDLHYLALRFEFDRATLTEAVRRTFEKRGTSIPRFTPIGLTRAYWDDPSRPAQVRAFEKRARITAAAGFAEECARVLHAFLSPLLEDLRAGERSATGTWRPGGPWGPPNVRESAAPWRIRSRRMIGTARERPREDRAIA